MKRPQTRLFVGLAGSLLLLTAAVVWAIAAPPPATYPEPHAIQDPTPSATPSITPVRPVPTGSPAHPAIGVIIGARSHYTTTPVIETHAAFNLSLGADCPGCPIPVLDVLGLNPANEGVLATYELNPSNAR